MAFINGKKVLSVVQVVGGGSGTNVEANPADTPTAELEKLKINNTTYSVVKQSDIPHLYLYTFEIWVGSGVGAENIWFTILSSVNMPNHNPDPNYPTEWPNDLLSNSTDDSKWDKLFDIFSFNINDECSNLSGVYWKNENPNRLGNIQLKYNQTYDTKEIEITYDTTEMLTIRKSGNGDGVIIAGINTGYSVYLTKTKLF